MAKTHRLLSLDGGGSWALIQAKTLIDLYGAGTTGHQVLSEFDLVAANSGGSIVAAALAADMKLSTILALFEDERQRRRIFSALPWYRKLNPLRLFIPAPQFSTADKQVELRAALGAPGLQPMGEVRVPGRNGEPVRFLFASYHFDRDRAKFLRSWASPAGAVGTGAATMCLADAVHASTNAPIAYFDKPALIEGVQYWDGGLTGYNNPVLAAATEARAEGWAAADIAVLSIGTGTTMLPLLSDRLRNESTGLFKPAQVSSLTADLQKVATTILADPPDSHTFLAHLMLGGGVPSSAAQCPFLDTPVVRMNPLIQPEGDSGAGWSVPAGLSVGEFQRLVELDMVAAEQADVALIVKLCELWMQGRIRNQAIRAGKDLACEIGHPRYADAVDTWKRS